MDNKQAKPLIIKMNRWIRNAAERVDTLFAKVKFIPVQLQFLDVNGPKMYLFNQKDRYTLSSTGAKAFRNALFQAASFVQNIPEND